jgi:ribosome-associated protein
LLNCPRERTLSINTEGRKADTPGQSPVESSQPGHASTEALEELIVAALEDDKAEDIVAIDLSGKSSVTDTMIIASGRSNRHVGAIADHVIRKLKEEGHGSAKVEGLKTCDWVLIDAGDVVVHLFRPEVRDFYDLEKMWSVSPDSLS